MIRPSYAFLSLALLLSVNVRVCTCSKMGDGAASLKRPFVRQEYKPLSAQDSDTYLNETEVCSKYLISHDASHCFSRIQCGAHVLFHPYFPPQIGLSFHSKQRWTPPIIRPSRHCSMQQMATNGTTMKTGLTAISHVIKCRDGTECIAAR